MTTPDAMPIGDRPYAFSVVIPTHNRPQALKLCLAALAAQQPPHGGFEVVVVDDGSVPPAELPTDLPGSFPVRLLRHQAGGPATARNFGASAARGRWLAFLDDDCQPGPAWLRSFEPHLDPGVLLGGDTRNGCPSNAAAVFNHHLSEALRDVIPGFVLSNNICLERGAFLAAGAFDDGFAGAGAEDRDLCARWVQSGRRVRVLTGLPAEACVSHFHPQTLRAFCRMHTRYGRGARRFHAKSYGSKISTPRLLAATLKRTGPTGLLWFAVSQVAIAWGYSTAGRAAPDPPMPHPHPAPTPKTTTPT